MLGKAADCPQNILAYLYFSLEGKCPASRQARSLGKYFLLVDNMLVVLGFFVVFPLISIRFVDQMAGQR